MNGLHLLALAASGLTVYVLYHWGRRSRDAEVARLSAALVYEQELREGTGLLLKAVNTDNRRLRAAVRQLADQATAALLRRDLLAKHVRECPACVDRWARKQAQRDQARAALRRFVRPGPPPVVRPATPEETAGVADYAERWLQKQRERRQQPGGGQLA